MKRSIFLAFFVGFFFSNVVWSDLLSTRIDALIEKQLPHATIGILVKDAKTGDVIYRSNSDKLLYPASNVKLFTAAAALYHLKPKHHFLTTLSQKNQNFYITFSGSPSLTIDNFTDLLLSLKKNNIKKINGDIILDTSRFKAPYYPGGESYDDLGWYYSAPDTAVILDENAEAYDVISAKKLGMPVTIKPRSAAPNLTVINQIITVNKEQEKEHCNLNIEIQPNNTLRLYGCMAQESKTKLIKLAIPDPVLMAKQIIEKTLKKYSLIFKGRIIIGRTPSDARIVTSYKSRDLIALIAHMLKESDNLYANSLTKELAFSLTKEGSFKQGAFAIKKILAEHTHLDMKQVVLTDGMGSRYNLITPEQIVLLLTHLYNDKTMRPIILNALPQAGVSGTLIDRMKKTPLEKKVFAKTGSMHDISSLSGYIINPQARSLIFSIVINGVNKPINTAKSLEDQILLTIFEQLSMEPAIENAFG
ncbi:D-alanyl-D-alanine carboxypeptidase/D-alanyl-D-alanine-endopeptidase [Legionella antarctica]|uniref:D-alanyl-D-alanine carboxypeptidase/D-alanyl-D-alanine endopeptidase n=1 Tax=Legionella antarctica TaxID=2708020 RepID=UPI001566C2D9|nr:D-alanyl-D-alanine carboxypeptidase/D-alanyl-D-alanine-endopeptidase [Legionella antarctica]